MNRRRHITAVRLARMSFVLAGGMLLVLIAFSSSADAGCGDYVFVRNAIGQLVRASSLMPGEHAGTCSGPNCPGVHSQLATPETMPPSPDESLPIKLPCRGPNCSGRSQLPAAPVPPAPQRTVQESTALLLTSNQRDQETGARFGAVPASIDHELHYPQSIFHPPR